MTNDHHLFIYLMTFINTMKELTFKLTIEEANLVLEGLGTMPFKTVFALIGKIQNQAADQLNENGQAQETSAPNTPAITAAKTK